MGFLFRIAILVLGYFYPAYKCFKAIDSGRLKSEQLHIWCQYWIIIAVFTGFERVADTFISWLPLYSGAKLAFVVYLWHPDTKGTEHIYQTFLKPLVSKHTESVDLNLVLLRDETVKLLAIVWDRLLFHVQLKLSGVLHQDTGKAPNAASQPVQGGLYVYPSVPSSLSSGKMQQQQQRSFYSGHEPLVTQSAIWPNEKYQRQAQILSYPVRSLGDPPPGQHVRPTQPSSHHTLPSKPAPKAQNLGAVTTASMLSTTVKGGHQGKEDTDFELVHSNEVPTLPTSKGASADLNKSNTPAAKGPHFTWWWW
eukprot:c22190_g1_i1 orf=364-1287(-)